MSRLWWIEGGAAADEDDRPPVDRQEHSPGQVVPDRRPGQAERQKLFEWRAQLLRRAMIQRRGSAARRRTEAQLRKLTTDLLRLEMRRP